MSLLADLLTTVFERRFRKDGLSMDLQNRSIEDLSRDLIASDAEHTIRALSQAIVQRFDTLDDAAKLEFFKFLATQMDIDAAAVRAALADYEATPSKASYGAFAAAAEPPRQEFIRRLNAVPGATGALVNMRADLLRLARKDPQTQALDMDFRHLFASWFNRGFLVLRPISWETPAHILEKIIAYEAVHEITSWDDLRRRLAPPDRRCFAFFHPAMPSEPLIFVEVALTHGVPSSVQGLLAETRAPMAADQADTAVFYSISNCQSGLASISFGNSLIKQVAADLSLELPRLKTFVTLSPIPGLGHWAKGQGINLTDRTGDELKAIAAHYLIREKGRGDAPLDPVARFHLGNGAQVFQLHADADTSAKGQQQSAGVMVNYLYDLSKVAQRHEDFTAGTLAASKDIKTLADAARSLLPNEKV